MFSIANVLQQKVFGNTLESYLWFAGILLVGLLFKRFISKLLSHFLFSIFKRYFKTVGVKKFIDLLTTPVSYFVLLLIFYMAFNKLEFPREWQLVPDNQVGVRMVLFKIFETLLVFSFAWVLLRLADFFGLVLVKRAAITTSRLDDQLVPFVKTTIKIFILVIASLFILNEIFEFNIASIVAGLGIGGLAVALAAKETLENLLGSFTIFLDKPFQVGDLVQVSGVRGHVEEVGFRSTRIRTLDKTFVTVPNKKMVDAELENQTERSFCRAKFVIGLVYSSKAEQIRAICTEIKNELSDHQHVKDGATVRFTNFNSSSLDIEVIYLVMTSDLDRFAEVKEELNFKIMEIVRNNGSDFAFPSTSVYMEKNG